TRPDGSISNAGPGRRSASGSSAVSATPSARAPRAPASAPRRRDPSPYRSAAPAGGPATPTTRWGPPGCRSTPAMTAPAGPGVARSSAPAPSRTVTRPARFDLTPNTPDVSLFPVRRWTAALLHTLRSSPVAAYDYGAPRGEQGLREALADHLGLTRGVVADPERIIVVSGAAQGVDLLARVLAGTHARRVAVEDPSLDSQPQRLRLSGLEAVGQPVDGDGLVVDGIDADAVLVTPAHQFPTGAVLSGVRRRELLGWARSRGALVIEDDYDAEFRYDREPVRALQGLDPGCVVYLGTASKTLAPALRLAWLVLPHCLADEAHTLKHLLDVLSPALEQRAL